MRGTSVVSYIIAMHASGQDYAAGGRHQPLLMRYATFFVLGSIALVSGLACGLGRDSDADTRPPTLTVPEGFRAEILYHPMADDSSSWVSLAIDPRGRLLASDQYGALYRIHPAAIGADASETRVEKLDIEIGHAQGLLWAFNSLYVMVNSEEGIADRGSGLYRVMDTDGDDQFDTIHTLASFEGFGEHGPHAVRLGPDGVSLYVVAGNHTELPDKYRALVPQVWREDQLIPVLRDPRGHAADRPAPGGWIARTDSVGENWDLVSVGFRNAYDIAFNQDGDLFTFDSDMEWDLGMPWYRSIRVIHVSSGSEFGWRTGSGKWPAYYPDNLPGVVDIGQGSPTGVVSGAGSAFPRRYERGLFVFDWSFGTIYFVDLQSRGSTYEGELEEFLSGVPLPLTDGVFGPDGAMYFTTGGRRLNSYLIRVSYTGAHGVSESAPRRLSPQQSLRRSLESYHGRQDTEAVRVSWPNLDHADRFVRYAARVAIEHQPVSTWQARALHESDPIRRLYAIIALARHGDPAVRDDAIRALLSIDEATLSRGQQLDLLRAYGLVCIRLGAPEGSLRETMLAVLDEGYPGADEAMNREQGRLLAALGAPGIVGKMLAHLNSLGERGPEDVLLLDESVAERSEDYGEAITSMRANMPSAREIDLVMSLRVVPDGWTLEERKAYFQWFYDALRKSGGRSYVGFLEDIRADAVELLTEEERDELADLVDAYSARALNFAELPQPVGPTRDWNRLEIFELMEEGLAQQRDLERGRTMYAAALCQACHRFKEEGGTIGPDLSTIGTRMSRGEILEAIDSPSDAVSDQYAAQLITLTDGSMVVGRVVAEENGEVQLNQNAYDPNQSVTLAAADIVGREDSPISIMPPRLLNRLNGEEVLDILAYLISGGDPEHKCYTGEKGCQTQDSDD